MRRSLAVAFTGFALSQEATILGRDQGKGKGLFFRPSSGIAEKRAKTQGRATAQKSKVFLLLFLQKKKILYFEREEIPLKDSP
jgi:hypothetical protein